MACPDFYDAKKVGAFFVPHVNAAVRAGQALRMTSAARDTTRIALVLVDMQNDFIHPQGSLCVPGAIEDCQRIIEWIYRHVGRISKIYASLDSHYPLQIFYSTWWRDAAGSHPPPHTLISADEVQRGKWQAVYEPQWSRRYVTELESRHRKQLVIWPFHTLVGTVGHNLTPALYEAISYHATARQVQPRLVIKGEIDKTEHYSIFEPEVKVPEYPQGRLNERLLQDLQQFDLVYIAGQAKSHCVLETVNSMMSYFQAQPDFIDRLRILEDGMSSVTVPGIDFDALANRVYDQHRERGLKFVTTQEPLG